MKGCIITLGLWGGNVALPSSICERKVDIPIEEIWDFVNDINNWASLVPGYQQHTMINAKQSIWICKGDIGFMEKSVRLSLSVTEWQNPNKIAFTLASTNNHVKGSGYFQAHKLAENQTKMTGSLSITAKGIAGSMINSCLRPFLSKVTADFTDNVIEHIQTRRSAVMQ